MNQHRTHSAGFTLIELMVSIAIALLLILGVNEVFRISSETAGQGQTLSTISRDDRAIQNTLTEDMRNIVPVASTSSPTAEGPCFMIDSRLQPAFRNAKDKAGAADPNNPLFDPVVFANSSPLPKHWNPVLINYRSHRVDRLGFFARGLFPRQTASSGPGAGYVSNTTATEAYIWYGHASLPGTNNTFYDPGYPDPANTSNQYASDFFLCRQAILLVPNPFDVNYLTAPGKGNNVPLAPLGWGSPSNDPAGYVIQDSRYDIGVTSMATFQGALSTYYMAYSANPALKWWYPLLFDSMRSSPTSTPPKLVPWRFKADPFLTKPAGYTGAKVTAASMALASPCLVRGCSQFIVEFAGNFYTKNDNGSMARPVPDPSGQLDFTIDVDPNGHQSRHIRWYGFPRDTNGDGIIDYHDVMPLYQFLGNAVNADNTPVDDVEDVSNLPSPQQPPYTNGTISSNCDYAAVFANDASAKYSYTAAWGPSSKLPFPKMIRVTVAIDDPNGRLGDAQVFEYVFDVQQ